MRMDIFLQRASRRPTRSRSVSFRPLRRLRLAAAIAACAWGAVASAGPYSPAPPAAGSDAIPATDPAIVEWASGYQNYVEGSPIEAAFTNPNEALGPFQDSTVDVTNLGDGGQITYTFAKPIVSSGTGPDFAVFGNGFESTPTAYYEKLAYVDVSVNGTSWYRMTNYDDTPGPVGTYGETDPTNIYGLAGKYQLGYGVGFSLSEVGLSEANYVRIVDVVGNGTDLDSAGNPIYDPYPNDNGFNVAGVAVLSAVPEPSTIVMALVGMVLLVAARARRGWRG